MEEACGRAKSLVRVSNGEVREPHQCWWDRDVGQIFPFTRSPASCVIVPCLKTKMQMYISIFKSVQKVNIPNNHK